MHKRIRSHLTYANAMATIAVFVALGGASYAAMELPKDSVGAAQLKAGAVTAKKIDGGALAAAGSWDGDTYSVRKTIARNEPIGDITTESVFCDLGDSQIGGGFRLLKPEVGTIEASSPVKTQTNDPALRQTGWEITYRDKANSIASGVLVIVRCADFAPAHQR